MDTAEKPADGGLREAADRRQLAVIPAVRPLIPTHPSKVVSHGLNSPRLHLQTSVDPARMQCQTVFLDRDEKRDPAAIADRMLGKHMAEPRGRKPVYPGFGSFLRELRQQHGLRHGKKFTLPMIARELARRGFRVQKALLSEWERGTIKKPNPGILVGLAEIYGLPSDAIIRNFVAEQIRESTPEVSLRFLSDRTPETPDARLEDHPPLDRLDAAAIQAAGRIITLSEELTTLANTILFAASGGQTPALSHTPPTRHAGHRKTGRKPPA